MSEKFAMNHAGVTASPVVQRIYINVILKI